MPTDIKTPFSGNAVRSYCEGLQRQVPGYSSLHRMISIVLQERTPPDGKVLVLGAGGGQEIKALAEEHPGWSFDGVDPSADMLELARRTTRPIAARVRLHEGYIRDAPEELYDAATSILVFHFIPREERLETLEQIRRRLKTSAPLILVHLSFPQTEPERSLWINRHVAYGLPGGSDPHNAENACQAIRARLTILSPEEEERMMRQAGFSEASLFFAGLSVKGWLVYTV